MTQYIQKLPAVFQTVTEKQFFSATFDQVFSKKDSDLLAGYIGRRIPGSYNPISDFYLPEPSKDRTWWQLEATAFARNKDNSKTNIFFYEDLLNRINNYGGNILNQDRLFESEYYSFGPPIDYDMFINYQNYYWVEQGLAPITISGVMGSDIIGESVYVTPDSAIPAGITLSTGMTIILSDDPAYSIAHIIENMGGCVGIQLVTRFPDFTEGTLFENLPWDGFTELSTGRIIQNSYWDINSWDTQAQPGSGDYVTIERGCRDRNAWSRTNKWFHIDTINNVSLITGSAFPPNSTRALRPIIQFVADLILYDSGTQFRDEIQFGFRDSQLNNHILLSELQGQQLSSINSLYTIDMMDGDLVSFFNDTTVLTVDFYPWEISTWESQAWDSGTISAVNRYIFVANLQPDGSVIFYPKTSYATPIIEGDIVFIDENAPYNGAQRGQTWYYSNGSWNEAFNDKISVNQPPLFQLYDHNDIRLDDVITYPSSSFRGSKIFSYKVNTTPGATSDPVLGFPIVYTSLGQSSDIIFQNNLIVDRYIYGKFLPITGYYYYKTSINPILFNNWNLYDLCDCNDIAPPPPCNCIDVSKQRVIDQYVVGYGTLYQFKLSVIPYGYPASSDLTPDIIVSVNGIEIKDVSVQSNGYTFVTINNSLYIDLTSYLTALFLTAQSRSPVVEIQTYTHGLLNPDSAGHFEIPQQLEANPNQLEIDEISGSNLIQQFSSIISNQIGFTGIAFGGNNNYRDSRKNRSVGSYILQNLAPMLKSMLISNNDDLDFISGIRFSQDEYTKFKNKYLSVALQLINQEFNPVQYHANSVVINAWVDQILKIVNISKEFSDAFAYSYMVASGAPTYSETIVIPGSSLVTLSNYIDLSDPKNVLYVYDVTVPTVPVLLSRGKYYKIKSTNLSIDVGLDTSLIGRSLTFYLYQNSLPTYIPSTPTKLGTYSVHLPRIELDVSYINPTNVIIGHDGSKTIAYGDYRDRLLLELELRIYNGIQDKFRNEYYLPLRLESIKSGYFRETRYTRDEYLSITESYLNKWSAKNRANYRTNDWSNASVSAVTSELWKLYNYRNAVNASAQKLNLPGNWKGIFQYYYDTYYPDIRPWEMLGLKQKPVWWVSQYGSGITNIAGQIVWPNNLTYAPMWQDIEAGIIRQGPSAIYDPITLLPQPQSLWARPGLSSIIPVDSAGEIIPIPALFNVAVSGNLYEPYDGFDDGWIYGDGAPVEQAWMSTSEYIFNIQEFMYLMRPGPYGELLWDTLGTDISPGLIEDALLLPGIELPVKSNKNWQFVQNDLLVSNDAFFKWMRPKNKDQTVHAEIIDSVVQVRFGYQTWISDRILFLGKNIGDTLGQKIRTLDVNLANKFAGFTNKDTTNTYIESVTPGASTNTLIIPSTNFDVMLHTGPSIDSYSYSGVIIRTLENGTFAIYGYDLLTSAFTIFNRTNDQLIDVSVGGTPEEFQYFNAGTTYNIGDIVRYNGVYYRSLITHTALSFISLNWQKLKGLPTVGGISVIYKPIPDITIASVPYGTIMSTPQEVFDFLIGWGDWLESNGWQFQDVNSDTSQVNNWLTSGKQFLFWLNSSWSPDSSIQLSPLANLATLVVKKGYPNDIESFDNDSYNILDKYGIAIPPNNTTIERNDHTVIVSPTSLSTGGIYFLKVNASETEHILIFDNVTNFNDVIYSPLLRARQQRLRFNGFRTNNWYGKMEAPGYLIIGDQLVPNYDTIVDSMRYYYDSNVTIDNSSLEDLGRHLIGYENKSYLDNLQVSNDIQYLFYQGAIRQKGTKQSFDKLFRSTKIQANEIIEVFEEWALKLGNFGNTIEQVSTEFILKPEQNTGEVLVARLNFIPSTIGFVKEINILNAENTYILIPKVVISAPDADPLDPLLTQSLRQATAYIVLGDDNAISRIDIIDQGYGYLTAPIITINSGSEPHNLDILYAVWQGEIIKDTTLDNIIDIDIDQPDTWTVRPIDPVHSLEFPLIDNITYPTPNAGYVNFNDVTYGIFDVEQAAISWGSKDFNPAENNTLWIANTFTQDWDVYKLVDPDQEFDIISSDSDELLLRTLKADLQITPQLSSSGNVTNFGNMISLQVIEAHATLEIDYIPSIQATATAIVPYTASVTSVLSGSGVSGVIVIHQGFGYDTVPIVTFDGPDTVGITTQGIAIIQNNKLIDIVITTPGSGYTIPPKITIESPLNSGQVSSVIITSSGSGYITTPNVTITGDGEYAVATAHIEESKVVGITINIPSGGGANYTFADIIIDAPPPPSGTGAIISANVTKSGANYNTIPNVVIHAHGPGTGAIVRATIAGGTVTGIIIDSPGANYTSAATIEIDPPLSIGGATNYAIGFTFDSIQTNNANDIYYYYNLVTLSGLPITKVDIPDYLDFTKLLLFKSMRFLTIPTLPDDEIYVTSGDKIWVDQVGTLPNVLWTVYSYDSVLTIYRQQESLINSSLFENVSVFDNNGSELVQLPIYDPFKNILPGPAKQNITYMTLQDPASYNITSDPRLFNENIMFGNRQVGQLWWDLSTVRYVYYEQPIAINETETDILVYRRNHWGQLFPGSTVAIYEWVVSPVPPSKYTGSGTPKDINTYVQLSTQNKFTNIFETKYYFWVLNSTSQPNIENRTMAAVDVALMLQSPKSQGFSFFSPIQQTSINNSYMFYNVQEILAYRGDNVQIQYRVSLRDDQKHTQWSFFREGDSGSLVTDQFWNKMVDSITGYTKLLPNTPEFISGIIINTPTNGKILPVPDPSLSDAEKYGILYRPRQGMFVNIQAARKIFVQSANSLLQYIPIRDINPSWNINVLSDTYWTYTNWYEIGYENSIPSIVFNTLTDASIALSSESLILGQIIQVTQGTVDGRYALYVVTQPNANVSTLSLEEIGIQNSSIKLLDTIYTSINKYELSTELRSLLDSFRTEVMINNYIVDQNELFFSMLNYVVSEQKNPDWVFKSSYIYIKENNLPLAQDQLYIPDQISNVIDYITDAKPYHTKIRDYTSTYITTDIVGGSASDRLQGNFILQFGPNFVDNFVETMHNNLDAEYGYDLDQGPYALPWDQFPWDADLDINSILNQFVSGNNTVANFNPGTGNPWPNLYTVPLTFFDSGKVGYSQLYPYTFTFDALDINNPQTFITPYNIIGVQIGTQILNIGIDYYVVFNDDNTISSNGTYTIYFYNDPGTSPVPVALVWWDGGQLLTRNGDLPRSETANGIVLNDMVINVDTRLPVNISTGGITPYVGWGDAWEDVTGSVAQAIIDAGGSPDIPWDAAVTVEILSNTISSKENINVISGATYYRNADISAGTLVDNILAPTSDTENLDVITVFVDPIAHPLGTDIFPVPLSNKSVAIWINGERIEYKIKELVTTNTWALKSIRRGTNGTAIVDHDAMIPSLANHSILVSNPVWVESNNIMPVGSDIDVWNAIELPAAPDVLTLQSAGKYTSIREVPIGGIWYSHTLESDYLASNQGTSIP